MGAAGAASRECGGCDVGLSGWGELVLGEGGRQSMNKGVEVGRAGVLGDAG